MSVTDWIQSVLTEDIWSTLILVVFLLLIRSLIVRALHRNVETLSETRRRWISIVQNTSIILIGFGLIFIWSPELSTFALSLTAFAVALVLATREFLLCMIGAIYRMIARPFNVGDWIEIGEIRGEVIFEGILTTRLQELGHGARRYEYTGRVLAMPNSMMMTNTIRNESFRKRYIHHEFSITLEPALNIASVNQVILNAITERLSESEELAERYWSMVRHKSRTELPTRKPSVTVETSDSAKIVFHITVFCPTVKAIRIQQHVTESVFEHVQHQRLSDQSGQG